MADTIKKAFAQGFGDGGVLTILNDFHDQLVDLIARMGELKTLTDELKADHNALLAKLDADAGVTDINYAATLSIAAAAMTAATAIKTAKDS